MNGSILRCKLRVARVTREIEADGGVRMEEVKLEAVYGKEGTDNARWAKWTPFANFTIQITNPAAFGTIASGHEFYIDFTPVPADVPTQVAT